MVSPGYTYEKAPDQNHFLSSLAYQAASAIERARLVTDIALYQRSPSHRVPLTPHQAVVGDRDIPSLRKRLRRMAPDVPRPTRHQNMLSIFSQWQLSFSFDHHIAFYPTRRCPRPPAISANPDP